MKWILPFSLLICLFAVTFSSCQRDENFITDSSARLSFSSDTLRFDTVFTTLGSATRILKVFNTESAPIMIDEISIKGNQGSKFRLNVDGIFAESFENVQIGANDSLYIFGEVTIDPDQPLSASPFVLSDEIMFNTNGNDQIVVLEAWGQNANYIPSTSGANGISLLSCDLETVIWDDPKPYVIYGILLVDSCTLNLPKGTEIYIHGGLARGLDEQGETFIYNDGLIFFLDNGRLVSEGTLDEPVIIQGDRLEENFDDVQGQWSGIRLGAGSKGNLVDHTIIKNSIIGIRADSSANLIITNSEIVNTASSGLLGIHAQFRVQNCLFHSNGGNCVQLEYGGQYEFDYCTLASYGVDASALKMSNALCLDLLCSEFLFNPLQATFRNSIIMGSREDELDLFDRLGEDAPGGFDYTLQDCIVRVTDLPTEDLYLDFFDHCNPCRNASRTDSLFVSVEDDDYHLDTLSIAEEWGSPLPNLFFDLDGVMRDDLNPDAGCYEYIIQ